MRKFFIAGVLGGVMAYFLDPKKGGQRRSSAGGTLGGASKKVSQQAQSFGGQAANQARSTSSQAADKVQTARSQATQAVQSAANTAQTVVKERIPGKRDNPDPDDLTLRDRVETQIFREEETSRENINISVVGGVVEVRGQLPQAEIDPLIQRIEAIPDVKSVHSYLHTPGTDAPNKESAIDAS